MRLRKTDQDVHAEINQLCMNINHEKSTLQEVLYTLISQREGLVELCGKQQKSVGEPNQSMGANSSNTSLHRLQAAVAKALA
jgi:hypothetical protein